MKILFVHQKMMSFVERDLKILKEEHEVRTVCFTGRSGIAHRLIPDLFDLYRGVKWCDMTFSWFGKLHAFFAVLFSKRLGKKSVVVSGGDDVANESEIGYGLFARRGLKWCPLYVFKNADLILSVSKSNYYETLKNAKADPAKIKMIHHGFETDYYHCRNNVKKEPIVLTVGNITSETLIKKGLMLFIQCAKYMPETRFLLVGPGEGVVVKKLKKIAAPNVEFTGPIFGEKLVEIFSRSKVYAQLSYGESFGCAVAEAMLCECVPVLSKKGALPEVGGNAAIYFDDFEPEHISHKLQEALASNNGGKSRHRIISEFSFEKRRQSILQMLRGI